MAPPQSSITASNIPTGGCVSLAVVSASSGTISISRATSGVSGLSAFTTLYSGAPLNLNYGLSWYFDLGDELPGNVLLPTSQYVYQLTDNTGTYTTPALTPVSQIDLDRTDWVSVLISLLQGAMNAIKLPAGINTCRITQAMPLNGTTPMPFITINPDMVQQVYVPIGQSAINLGGELIQPGQVNIYTQPIQARNVFRVSVFSMSPVERDFYRDFILAVFRVSLISVFQPLGLDTEHDMQASSFQTVTIQDGQIPGFYACDVLLTLTGSSNVTIFTTYGIIETVTGDFTGAEGSDTQTQAPTGA